MGQCSSKKAGLAVTSSYDPNNNSDDSTNSAIVIDWKTPPGLISRTTTASTQISRSRSRRGSFLRDSAAEPLDESESLTLIEAEASLRSQCFRCNSCRCLEGHICGTRSQSIRDMSTRSHSIRDFSVSNGDLDPLPEKMTLQEQPKKEEQPAQQPKKEVMAEQPKKEEKVKVTTSTVVKGVINVQPNPKRRSLRPLPEAQPSNDDLGDHQFTAEGDGLPPKKPRPSLQVKDLANPKPSSWQALSCTSNNSSMYSSYEGSWKFLQQLDSMRGGLADDGDVAMEEVEVDLTPMHMSRMEKSALNHLHGFCLTESEDEHDSEDEEDPDGDDLPRDRTNVQLDLQGLPELAALPEALVA